MGFVSVFEATGGGVRGAPALPGYRRIPGVRGSFNYVRDNPLYGSDVVRRRPKGSIKTAVGELFIPAIRRKGTRRPLPYPPVKVPKNLIAEAKKIKRSIASANKRQVAREKKAVLNLKILNQREKAKEQKVLNKLDSQKKALENKARIAMKKAAQLEAKKEKCRKILAM